MKKTLFCLFSLLLVLPAHAQTRRRPAPTPAQPATSRAPRKLVETVRTPDGREIHLYDDMTYDIAASAVPARAGYR